MTLPPLPPITKLFSRRVTTIKPATRIHFGRLIFGFGLFLALLTAMLTVSTESALAEGSRELVANGGSRPNTEWRTSRYGGAASPVLRRTTLTVFAKANERIFFGSSAVGVAGTATGNAVLVAAGGNLTTGPFLRNCLVDQPGNGFLNTRAKEMAGPLPTAGGYTPCTFDVVTTGLYDIAFWGPDGASNDNNGAPSGSIAAPPVDGTQGGGVAMWDITVRDPGSATPNADINGRVFSRSFALFTGGNPRPLQTILYAVTIDGFIYRTNMRGVDPNGFAVYGNNIGFYDSDGTTPLYHDLLDGVNNQLTAPQGGVTFAAPLFPIFVNPPDPEAITANSITLTPVVPSVTGASFTGNIAGNTSTTGSGGNFTITTNIGGIYEIVISRDGIDFDPTNPNNRVLRGIKTGPGPQIIPWNGKDNNNVDFPPSVAPPNYPVRVTLHAGEYHFPLLDSESSLQANGGGPGYQLINSPSAGCAPMPFGCTTGYFDDRGYRTISGILVGAFGAALPGGTNPPAAPFNAVFGYDTTDPARRAFGDGTGTGWGDKKGLDIWTFLPSTLVTTNVVIIPNPGLLITKDDGGISVPQGGTVVYTLSYTNTATTALAGVIITDTVPVNTTFSTAGSTAGWSCANGAPAGTVCTLNIGNLALGASGTATIAFVVANPYPAGTTPISNTVFIRDGNGTGTSGGSGGDTTPVSAVLLTKTDNGVSSSAGGVIVYTLNYTNTGGVALAGVILTDTVPANTTFNAGSSTAGWAGCSTAGTVCTFTVGALATGAFGQVNIAFTVDNPLPGGVTQIANTAFIRDGNGTGSNGGSGGDTTPLGGILLTKTDGGVSSSAGGVIIYTLNYTNTGAAVLNGVILTDTVPANTTFNAGSSTAGWAGCSTAGTVCTFTVGALAVGASGQVNIAFTVDNPLPGGVTQIANTAFIRDGNGTGSNGGSGGDTTPLGAVLLTKTDNGASSNAGGVIVYTLNYTNTGAAVLNGVILTDTVPANTTFNAGSSTAGWAGCSTAGTVCTFTVGALATGAFGQVNIAFTVDNPLPGGVTQIVNTAFIRDGNGTGSNGGSGGDTTPLGGILLTKTDNNSTSGPGGVIIYTLNYTNTGGAVLNGVILTDTVPANTTFNAGSSTAGWAGCSTAGTVCTFTVGALAVGASGQVNIAFTVDNPLPGGVTQILNTAFIRDGNGTGSNGGSGGDTTPLGAILLTKTDNGATTSAGGVVIYTLNYTNTGGATLAGVILTDSVPANTTFNAGSSTAGWGGCSTAGTVCTLTIGALATGAFGTVNIAFTVDNPLPGGVTQIANTAFIRDGNGTGSNGGSGGDTTPLAGILLTKTDNNSTSGPGGTIIYSLNYTNTGGAALAGVILTDTVPANTTFNAGSSTAGWGGCSTAGTVCTFTIGALAAGAFGTVNIAFTVDNPLPAGVTQILNTAFIRDGNGGGGTGGSGGDTTPLGAILLTKTDNGVSSSAGGVVIYTLNYTNVGGAALAGVILTDSVPANTTFNAGSSTAGWAGCSTAGTVCTLTVGALATGASGTVNIAFTVDNPLPAGVTQVANTAFIRDGNGGGSNGGSGGDTTPIAAITLAKTDGGISTTPGGTIPYTLSYANSGGVILTGVVINETVPANTTFNAAGSTAGWSCADGSPAGTACTLTVGTLATGGSGTATFALTVSNPYAGGSNPVANSATINGTGQNGGSVTATSSDTTPVTTVPPTTTPPVTTVAPTTPAVTTAPPATTPAVTTAPPATTPAVTTVPPTTPAATSTIVTSFDPFILKTVEPKVAVAGQTVAFTLVVSNPGVNPAENVVATDPIPSIFRILGTTTTQGSVSVSGQLVTVNIGTLAPGATVTVVITTVVTEGANGNQVNTATIKGTKEGKPFDGAGDAGAGAGAGSFRSIASVLIVPTPPNTGKAYQVSPSGLTGDRERFEKYSVRTESSDYEMFGKNLSTRLDSPELGVESLKPANHPVMPRRVRIPALEVDNYIQPVGLHGGAMDVPDNIWEVGWLNSSALPGATGNSVLAGHKDSQKGTAVFWALDTLHKGNLIYISDENGNELTFEVESVELYSLSNAPLARIFGPTSEAQLTLISCAGSFLPNQHTYDQRVVVYARLVSKN